MKKFVSLALGSVLALAAAAGLASCGKKQNKRCGYNIKAEYLPDTQTLSAEMTANIVNPTDASADELKFQLWPNAFREGAQNKPVSDLYRKAAYYGGESYGGITVTEVGGCASFDVCGEDENILSVKLKSPLGAGKRVSLTFTFDVQLANVNHRLGVTEGGVNLANFYPVLCAVKDGAFCEYLYSANGDPFVNEIADYDVTLTLPASYTLVSGFGAKENEESATEGKKAYHVRADGVRDVAFVFGEDFECLTENADGVEISYYYPAEESDPASVLRAAKESLAFYSETFGGYLYPRYTVVTTGFVYGGMEFPALSMISSGLRQSEIPSVVAHETAHQWWYSMVGSNQYECAWQDEGLAEYSTALFLGAHPDYGVTYRDFISASERSFRAFYSVFSQVNGSADTTMNRPLTSFSGDYEYRNIAYDKGVILFDRVSGAMGERKCKAALKRYFETYKNRIATPEDLIACFERSSAGISELFASFIEGKCVI